MVAECRETFHDGLTLTVSTPESVALVLSLLDEESSGDRDALVEARGYIAWLGRPEYGVPIAFAGGNSDTGERGANVWMVTTTLLQKYKAQRHLMRAMQGVIGRIVQTRGYAWGVVCRTHSTVRMLDRLGAEFTVERPDSAECVWCIEDNRKLWRRI